MILKVSLYTTHPLLQINKKDCRL
uniref:Uncharacterized protein n=1 Tax=Anguilla anguilla TaxID=7936 RepID=A0A0E9V8N1_ANGAN